MITSRRSFGIKIRQSILAKVTIQMNTHFCQYLHEYYNFYCMFLFQLKAHTENMNTVFYISYLFDAIQSHTYDYMGTIHATMSTQVLKIKKHYTPPAMIIKYKEIFCFTISVIWNFKKFTGIFFWHIQTLSEWNS